MKVRPMNHYIFKTPLGHAAIVFEIDPVRLVKTFLPMPAKDDLLRKMPPASTPVRAVPAEIKALSQAILAYLKGAPMNLSFADLPMAHLTRLQQAVLKAVFEIPYGQTRSYGEIAAAVGRPGASRFVGSTMAGNPFPLIIPCHRVIKSDGTFGRFGGGTALKATLIWKEKQAADKKSP